MRIVFSALKPMLMTGGLSVETDGIRRRAEVTVSLTLTPALVYDQL
jgi:hypothetical protein